MKVHKWEVFLAHAVETRLYFFAGNGKILRRWFEVHYFEDYKYEPYVAGELTRKHLVQRKSFNFTIGSDLRCQRAQIRFEHCNGPLHAGSYR